MQSSTFYIYDWETEVERKLRITRDFLREMDMFQKIYGSLPDDITIRGKLGKPIYDAIKKFKLNFIGNVTYSDYYDNIIIMKSNKEINMEEDKNHDFGMIYTKHTKFKPEHEINIIQI